jgi:hypothetical protein
MIRFGFFYIQGEMVIYDLTIDTTAGYAAFVATLSADTTIAFRAVRPETAIERLREYLERRAVAMPTLEKVTWMPTRVELPGRVVARPH